MLLQFLRSLRKKKLDKISDLKKVEKDIIAGFTLEFHDREDGNQGLKKSTVWISK